MNTGPAMLGIGLWELVIALAVIVLLFGAHRIPALASGFGKAIRNFRDSASGGATAPAQLERPERRPPQ